MLKLKKITDLIDMDVYTDSGEYFGVIEESIIGSNKVTGWRVRATKNSYLSKILGGAKGVIIPHKLVKSIGDVVIINKAAIPDLEQESEEKTPIRKT